MATFTNAELEFAAAEALRWDNPKACDSYQDFPTNATAWCRTCGHRLADHKTK